MAIKIEEDGTYTVRYEARIPGRSKKWNRQASGLKSRAEAERRLRAFIVDAENTKTDASQEQIPSWEEAYKSCIEAVSKEFEKTTLFSFDTTMRKWCNAKFSHLTVDQISEDMLRQIIEVDMDKKSISQKKNVLKFLRKFFRHCIAKHWISSSPVPNLSLKDVKKIHAVLKENQFNRLLELAEELNHEWYPIWALALMTGLRNGELFALTWDQIDTQLRTITVRRNWTKKSGHTEIPKDKAHRVVEFPQRLIPILEKLRAEDECHPFVLPRVDGWECGRQAEILRTFLIGASLPRVRFHDLRASWATFLLNNGVPAAKVMASGGWEDLKTMMKYVRTAGIDIEGASKPFDK